MADKSPIKVGGGYVENEDHVPNPTDMVAQFNTSGTGAHGRIEEVAPIFEVDKVKTAQEIEAALDPKNDNVPASRVVLPSQIDDNDEAKKDLKERAASRLKKGVEIGGPTPAEDEAAKEGDEGEEAAVEQERGNAAGNSTGQRNAGQHTQKGDSKGGSTGSSKKSEES